MTNAAEIRAELTPVLIESITNTEDGAGSDLGYAEWTGDEWIVVSHPDGGALDIHHLVGDVIEFLIEKGVIER